MNSLHSTVKPVLLNDSHLTEHPPHLLVSVNGLCQDDQYTVSVTFGTQRKGMMGECEFQQPNVTRTLRQMFEEINVPADIVPGDGEDYCYYAVLINTQGRIIDGTYTHKSIFC